MKVGDARLEPDVGWITECAVHSQVTGDLDPVGGMRKPTVSSCLFTNHNRVSGIDLCKCPDGRREVDWPASSKRLSRVVAKRSIVVAGETRAGAMA